MDISIMWFRLWKASGDRRGWLELKSRPFPRWNSSQIDDGYSSVNFERPGFKEMMEDIWAGKVDCVIVKDLSRFGRNYIEAGN